MTALIAWVAYSQFEGDNSLPVAVYVASDSRITWGMPTQRWDAGRKVFASSQAPHLFGYCGDVVFPSLVLGQVAAALDAGVLYLQGATSDEKHEVIFSLFKNSFDARYNAPDRDFWIVHVLRERPWPDPKFQVWIVEYSVQSRKWGSRKVELPTSTDTIVVLGTGASTARAHIRRWIGAAGKGASWAIFSGFCDALRGGVDRYTGGPPQLAAIYSAKEPRHIGILSSGKLHLNGLHIPKPARPRNVEWCDEQFQRVSPTLMRPARGARRFLKPHLLT